MSSPTPSTSPGSPSGRRFFRAPTRSKLRNATFILPRTGERVQRQFTLRDSSFGGAGRPNISNVNDFFNPEGRTSSTVRAATNTTAEYLKGIWAQLKTPTSKAILKCSLAYLLGSMGTFFPPAARFLGHQDGKHMVATITVYFHPARSAGSMEEAAMLGIGAFCYAVFISVSSMAVSVLCETQLGMIELGYALILILFCGGGLGFIGWFKQKYNAPLVNVACSLASLAIITVLTKENAVQVGVFSDDKIVQVMKMILMGIFATSAVSLLLWPVSARAELRETMIKATDSFGDMLTTITRGFLSGSEAELRSTSSNDALIRYKSVFTQLAKNLKEAKMEHYALGTEDEYRLEASLVECLHKLAQCIGGLRSAATTQFTLLREGGSVTPITPVRLFPQSRGSSAPPTDRQDRFGVLTAIEERSEEGSGAEDHHTSIQGTPVLGSRTPRFERQNSAASVSSLHTTIARTPAEIFSRFITHLGPSMKSLAYSLSQILGELPFGPGPDYAININEHFSTSLTDALALYSDARGKALKELYKSKELDKDRPESIEADFEEVAASCGQFSFSLYHFGSELQNLMTILEDLREQTTKTKNHSWKWMRFWQRFTPFKAPSAAGDPEREPLLDRSRPPIVPKNVPEVVVEGRHSKHQNLSSRRKNAKEGLYSTLFQVMRVLERDNIRFALKVGIGAALYALFAFIPATRPFYQLWRGEWGLLSYMLVCSMTIGASNTTGWSRFIGTFIGAILAIIVWAICQENPFALIFCGWVVSLPCFYIIIAKGNGPFGRFIMLTYNLSCLYAYSLSIKETDDDDDEGGATPFIIEIAYHRVVAVLAGVVWGLIISRMIWPISARQKFKDGLALLWLRMGLIWKTDPLLTLSEGESQYSYMNLREELGLQKYVLGLDKLRSAASNEFELRGPFPSQQYGRIVESTNRMLDAFHAMNMVIQQDPHASEGEAILLRYTAKERAQLCTRISNLFQVLASSMKLEYSLQHAVPDTDTSRDRLLAKIFQYRKDTASAEEGTLVAKDEDYEMLYSYTLVTGQLAREIKKVELEVEELFGTMDEEVLKLE